MPYNPSYVSKLQPEPKLDVVSWINEIQLKKKEWAL